jgi:hypothetical protein
VSRLASVWMMGLVSVLSLVSVSWFALASALVSEWAWLALQSRRGGLADPDAAKVGGGSRQMPNVRSVSKAPCLHQGTAKVTVTSMVH